MADAAKEKVISKPPVSLGMYRSSHKRDYQWCEQYKAPSEEDIQKLQVADSQLKAKEFAVPREQQVVTSSDGLVGEGREVIPAPSIPASSRADNAGESYLPKYHPATELAAARAEELERLQGFAMPEKLMSYCQHLPAAAQTPETAEVHPQKLVPAWATYQHFTMEMFRAMQHDAQQNKSTNMGTSLSVPECFDRDWGSTYSTDFQHWPGPYGEHCKGNQGASHIFPKDVFLNQSWVSEYKDNYSIFLRRLNRKPLLQSCALGTPLGKGPLMDTAQ